MWLAGVYVFRRYSALCTCIDVKIEEPSKATSISCSQRHLHYDHPLTAPPPPPAPLVGLPSPRQSWLQELEQSLGPDTAVSLGRAGAIQAMKPLLCTAGSGQREPPRLKC